MTIPRVPSSVILLPFPRKDFQQRQIALRPARKYGKNRAILGRAVWISFRSLYYGTFFILIQGVKRDISMTNSIFVCLKRHNEVTYVKAGAGLTSMRGSAEQA